MSNLLMDLKAAMRVLLKSPGLITVAILSLGFGLGVNATLFSLVNVVLLKTIPVDNPAGLVYVLEGRGKSLYGPTSYPNYLDYRDYLDYREQNSSFSGLAAYSHQVMAITDGEQVQSVNAQIVSGNYFSVLGVKPMLGRAFIAGEDDLLKPVPVVVISHALWKDRFNSDPGVIGKQISLNKHSFTIIGIAPEGFTGIVPVRPVKVWVTIPMWNQVLLLAAMVKQEPTPSAVNKTGAKAEGTKESDDTEDTEESPDRLSRGHNWLSMMGRLKPGARIEQAQAEMEIVLNNVKRTTNTTQSPLKATLSPVSKTHPQLLNQLAPVAILSLGAAFLVLLIACVNVATLIMARGLARSKEVAIRVALGSSRARLIRQLLTESLLLALICGLAGLLLPVWTSDLIRLFVPPMFSPFIPDLHVDLRVMAFTLTLSLLIGILSGLMPALNVSKTNLLQVLNGQTGLGRSGRRKWSSGSILITAEVAVSFVLLICAGLFVRGLQSANTISSSYLTENILILGLDSRNFGKKRLSYRDYQDLEERVGAIPGVQSVSFSHVLPLGLSTDYIHISDEKGNDYGPWVGQNIVSHNYFRAMNIPVLQGRDFTDKDNESSPNVIVVNDVFAQKFWPHENPIGKVLRMGYSEAPLREVVAVVSDSRYSTYNERLVPNIYAPVSQRFKSSLSMIVRTSTHTPMALSKPIREQIQAINSNSHYQVLEFRTFDELASLQLAPLRAGAALLGGFGLIALLTGTIGIYGVTRYVVINRTREIGIRIAMGAQSSDVLKLIIKEGGGFSLIGVAIGLTISLVITRFMTALLYGISPSDPITYIAISLFLTGVVIFASYIPARKAMKIRPVEALRCE